MNELKYIIFRGEVIPLHKNAQGLWADGKDTVLALIDPALAVDDHATCGIGILALPDTPFFVPVNRICKVHDYMGMSPAYQAFNTFDDANDYLENGISKYGEYLRWLALPFRALASSVTFWWENKKTLKGLPPKTGWVDDGSVFKRVDLDNYHERNERVNNPIDDEDHS